MRSAASDAPNVMMMLAGVAGMPLLDASSAIASTASLIPDDGE